MTDANRNLEMAYQQSSRELFKLRGQRDELLAALQSYVDDAASDPVQGRPGSPFQERLRAGRLAIDNATRAARSGVSS